MVKNEQKSEEQVIRELFFEEGLCAFDIIRKLRVPLTQEQIVFDILSFSSWEEYRKEKSKNQRKQRKNFQTIREKVLGRDDYKCRVTQRTDNLVVHHIDHNRRNNDLNNLITIHNKIHRAIHSNLTISMEIFKFLYKRSIRILDTSVYLIRHVF